MRMNRIPQVGKQLRLRLAPGPARGGAHTADRVVRRGVERVVKVWGRAACGPLERGRVYGPHSLCTNNTM